jgi:hypothetical protein
VESPLKNILEETPVKHGVPGCAATNLRPIKGGQTVSDIVRLDGVDVEELPLDGSVLSGAAAVVALPTSVSCFRSD